MSTTKFDGSRNQSATVCHFYDGNEVIAEYDAEDTVLRRYNSWARGCDERAVMIQSEWLPMGHGDVLLLLRELGYGDRKYRDLNNGALAEGYAQ